jgi:hypothetical protein
MSSEGGEVRTQGAMSNEEDGVTQARSRGFMSGEEGVRIRRLMSTEEA